MEDNAKHHRNFIWVKDSKGNTYLCQKENLKDPKDFTEEELRECLDESENPQNN